jgi:TRAP-type transport system periplasmic protein
MSRKVIKLEVLILVGAMLLVSLLAGACATPVATTIKPTPNATSTEIIKLRMGTTGSPTNPEELLDQQWIEKIQNETNGRVQITLYGAGTLIDMFSSWDQLLSGVADIAQCTGTSPGAPFPFSSVIPSFCYQLDLAGSRQVVRELWKIFPELEAEYANGKLLWTTGMAGYYACTQDRPIRTLSDFKGLQMNPLPSYPELLGKLGATGTQMPGSESYAAVEKGILDGACIPVNTLQGMNWADITPYATNLHYHPAPGAAFFAMNLNVWNSLPPDIQKVFEDSIPWMNAEVDKLSTKIAQESIDYSKGKGVEFIELPSEDVSTMFGYIEELALEKAAKLDAKGLPGTKLLNETNRLVEQYANK